MSSPTYNWDRWQLGFASEYLEWIYRLIRKENPQSILEVGLGPGASTVAAILAVGDVPNPHNKPIMTVVTTIDINPPPKSIERVEELTHPGKRWNLLYGDSSEVMERMTNRFDYVYIDGDHSEEGVYRDAVAGSRLVNPGGILIFDDAGAKEFIIGVNAGIKRWHDSSLFKEEFPNLDVINPHGARVFRRRRP